MKKTLRSLLSMVMALSMLLSMVLISGLTASAATIEYLGEEVFKISADFAPNGYTIIPDATGNGFTIDEQVVNPSSGYAGYLDIPNPNGLKYLVLEVDSASGAYWSIDYLTPDVWTNMVGTGRYVLELGGTAFQGILWFVYGGGNGLVHVEEMYLTDTMPSVEPINVPVFSFETPHNNATSTTATADGLGVTFSGFSGSYGYAYFPLGWAQVQNTPYLVVDIVDSSMPNFGGQCDVTYTYAGRSAYSVRSADRQIIDLREVFENYQVQEGDPGYPNKSNDYFAICFTFTADIAFDALYLTNVGPVTNQTVIFETNGGTAVDAQTVANGSTLADVTTTQDGYTFAGWYTDDALTEEFDFATAVTDDMTLYAKWVLAGDISPVFGQLQTGTTAGSESAAIRFAAVIDSRDFAEAGFVFSKVTANPTVDDAASLAVSTTTVWTSINAAGSVVTAEELHGSYIFACTVNGIGNANFGTELYVRAYVKDFDGNYTYTDAKTYSVTDMLG